jgi:putative DNA primase/helicase
MSVANGTATALAANQSHGLPLFEQHYRELVEGSGLTAETIKAAGFYSEGNVDRLAALVNRKRWPRAWGVGLVLPTRDASGAIVATCVKPTHPPADAKSGKPRKYLHPTGSAPRLYVPQATFAVLDDPTARLLLTEGHKKAEASTQSGFHCVGLAGVDNWHDKRKLTLSPDLARIAWKDRPVYIAFDSDAAENENVARAERELAAVLTAHGAKVLIVRIPPAADGAKQGIDDFIVANGAGAFQKLLERAAEPESPDAGELKAAASDCDPAIEASHILAACTLGEFSRLMFWRGSWWWWSNGCWREKPGEEVRAEVVNRMNERWLDVKARIVSDVMEHLRAKAMAPSSFEPPTWRGKPPHGWPADECLATKNSIVHLPSLVERREPNQIPATTAFLTTAATDFALDLNATRPDTWLAFLDALWGDDPASIEALQEWFGYLLTHDTRQQKLLLLVGPKRSGKGTIARVLTALVGKGNVAAPTLGGLATNFGLWPLIGKSVAIISDARLSGRADQAAVVERLLSISGEDSITVDRKNQQPLTLRLPTRFVILTNELPKLTDASGAVVSRVVLLHTTQSFYGREDHDLTDKLLIELPGILLWAIKGWRRLRERGRFIQPESSAGSLDEMDDLASPVAAFVRDCCNVDRMARVTVSALFAEWKRWCEQQGREKYVGSSASFGRDLLAAEPSIRRKRLREGDDRQRAYEGIEIRSTWSA